MKCDFDKYGAPIVVFTDDIEDKKCDDGATRRIYGLHYEVVSREHGCNVWHIVPLPENTERPIKPTKILSEEFEIKGHASSGITERKTAVAQNLVPLPLVKQ